ncbi:MAG: DUF819 family protein [Bacteroidia bacterium]|nr:DUF819 family protein [Bacteroidia bacterium]
MVPALLILFYLLASALVVFLCNRFKWMNNVGAILWAYGIGLVIGSLHLLPEGSIKIQSSISDIAVPLAIPLLLFSLDFKRWVKLARITFLSMLTAFAGVVIAISIGFFIFRHSVPDANKVAGMLSGVYTGGTPNMFALKTALSLTITTLGLGASFIPKINRIKKSFQLGMYLIVVFSMAIASMADIRMLFNMTNGLFFFVLIAVFGSLIIQVFISSLLKIDADTTIITSTAFVFSPPFVPVVAGALKNKEVIISGITVGLIGYAIGNYLGVTLSYILGLMM